MVAIMKPQIATLNEQKIHVIRKPGFTAWILLTLSTIICIEVSQRLTKNGLYLIALVLGEIMFGLDTFGEWQELLLDKHENKAVVQKYTWNEKLSFKMPEKLCTSMKLSDIRHVGVSIEMGLFILLRCGKMMSLSMQGLTREELQQLRKDINYFLNINKIESLVDTSAVKSHFTSNDLMPKNLYGIVRISDNVLTTYKNQCPVFHNLSSPVLGTDRNSKKGRQCNLRKGPYTEKSMKFQSIEYI